VTNETHGKMADRRAVNSLGSPTSPTSTVENKTTKTLVVEFLTNPNPEKYMLKNDFHHQIGDENKKYLMKPPPRDNGEENEGLS